MTLLELMKIINEFYNYLQNIINFDSDGWPIFEKENFLDEWPEDVTTFGNRNSFLISQKEKTLICSYMGDIQNYRRFMKIMIDIPIYQQYLGVVVPDITITRDMDYEMQEMIMLANQMFAAVLVANNIKIVFNTRSGSKETTNHFKNVPRHIMCASGFLGCSNSTDIISAAPYVNKILGLLPDKLVIYGKHDCLVDNQLDLLGINYRYYPDFHTRSKLAYKIHKKGGIDNNVR